MIDRLRVQGSGFQGQFGIVATALGSRAAFSTV